MKYRKDFVTNSSSSSYVCDICGDDESGWDMGLAEAEMVECVNGHTFCESHITMNDDKRAILLSEIKQYADESDYEALSHSSNEDILDDYLNERDGRYDCHECLCPICSFEVGYSDDIVSYLKAKYSISDESILAELKSKFSNYEQFKEFLKGE